MDESDHKHAVDWVIKRMNAATSINGLKEVWANLGVTMTRDPMVKIAKEELKLKLRGKNGRCHEV